jgi:hypothetical protein
METDGYDGHERAGGSGLVGCDEWRQSFCGEESKKDLLMMSKL